MASSANTRLTEIWVDRTVSSNATKIRLAKCLILAIVTYVCETWTAKKEDRKKIEAFEIWVYRWILRVSWVEHRTNQSILDEPRILCIGYIRIFRLLGTINRVHLTFFDHIVRRNGSMEKWVVEEIWKARILGEVAKQMGRPTETSVGS